MTIGELRKILEGLPDDAAVVVTTGMEGTRTNVSAEFEVYDYEGTWPLGHSRPASCRPVLGLHIQAWD